MDKKKGRPMWPVGRAGHAMAAGSTFVCLFGGLTLSSPPPPFCLHFHGPLGACVNMAISRYLSPLLTNLFTTLGYGCSGDGRASYLKDLWVLGVKERVPSLTSLCCRLLHNRPDMIRPHTHLPEELKEKITRAWFDGSGSWQKVEAAKPRKFKMVGKTTSGIAVVDNKLWVWGGSDGSPTDASLYIFDFVRREWECLPVNGDACPGPSNYAQMGVWGRQLVVIGDHAEGVQRQGEIPRNIYFFDTDLRKWWSCPAKGFNRGNEGYVSIFNNHIYYIRYAGPIEFLVASLTHIQTQPKNNDATPVNNPNDEGQEKEEEIVFSSMDLVYEDGMKSPRGSIACCCVMGNRLYVAFPDKLYVTQLPANPFESGSIPPLKMLNLTGDALQILPTGMTMAGLAHSNQLVLFGGGCWLQYSKATFLVSVAESTAHVTKLDQTK
jgi:hypothetical protein